VSVVWVLSVKLTRSSLTFQPALKYDDSSTTESYSSSQSLIQSKASSIGLDAGVRGIFSVDAGVSWLSKSMTLHEITSMEKCKFKSPLIVLLSLRGTFFKEVPC
jgi:hypothetical protein